MSDKFKNKYRIESNRCQMWDYSAPGGYFLTVCINNREEILGTVKNKQMTLSDAGKIVADHLTKIPEYHPRVILDERIVMPHHIHTIIIMGDYDFHNGICKISPNYYVPVDDDESQYGSMTSEQYRKIRRQMLIPKIIGKFQMQSSKEIHILNNTPGKRNWQRGYHDRVIRNEIELKRIRKYIINNSAEWENKKNNDEGLWQ
jgi:putative transposase